ncbi:translation initiation factor IF-2 [uncultured Thomasclavelia sp.]|uniref:translation initiation factor IF-2 n=1 Tax=uncultured Thomasclavelia sp. TaxID=3025759 RepID=UPI0025D220AE|nr:translation initiation factor IF-2 [uncultured Thomasclavelia sp.]
MAKHNKQNKNRNKKGAGKKKQLKSNFPTKKEETAVKDGVIVYEEGITVGQLAEKIGQTPANVIKVLFLLGMMVTINSSLTDEQVELICLEYGFDAEKHVEVSEVNFEDLEVQDDEKDLVPRCPVVTIMGHVDHGKTTLLDTIRKSAIVEGEFGGITQHIGAYQVDVNGKKVTFLDTPGHEAFTAMRARGAQVTDIVIIVVAADDGVMPQTKEAIDHAKAANVPIVVAINKIDKEGADPERIKGEMAEQGLLPEEWGGDTVYCEISAKKGIGIEELLETLTVVAELADLKANPNRLAYGSVVEGKLDKGRGPVATLLVSNGTLRTGDPIVVGTCYGRVRQMLDDRGKVIKEALPATPVEITGLNDVPIAGDKFMVFESEKQARSIGEARLKAKQDKERSTGAALSLDDLFSQIKEGEILDLNIIVKADVQGTAEAVKASLEKISVEGVRVNVIRSTAGGITESDVLLASASNAIIYGFNVRPNAKVRQKAEEEGVEIRLHNIIYKMVEEIETAMKGMLAPEVEEVITGQAEIREVIKISKIGNIAGCYVTDGYIPRNCGVRLIRDGVVVYEGKLASLRRFQDDVKEVQSGFECGLSIENYNDIKEGDIVEGYIMQEIENK